MKFIERSRDYFLQLSPGSGKASARFFFEKKKQKTFAPAGCGDSRASAHRKQKFFGYFFNKVIAYS